MNSFNYQYPVKQYFGKGCAEDALKKEMPDMGSVVTVSYTHLTLPTTERV